jgi:hypothetical protein
MHTYLCFLYAFSYRCGNEGGLYLIDDLKDLPTFSVDRVDVESAIQDDGQSMQEAVEKTSSAKPRGRGKNSKRKKNQKTRSGGDIVRRGIHFEEEDSENTTMGFRVTKKGTRKSSRLSKKS